MNDRIKELRETLNLSMEKFGSQIGISRSAISKLESGISNVSERTILSICRTFHVDYFWLTEGTGEMFLSVPDNILYEISEEYDLDDVDQKIIEKYLNLSKEQRAVIKNYLKEIFT